MDKFLNKFGKSRVVTPVVHVTDYDQAFRNVELAKEAGADGVWIISHGSVGGPRLAEYQKRLAKEFDWNQIGINCLDLDTQEAFCVAMNGGMGVWTDNAYIDEDSMWQDDASAVRSMYENLSDIGLYFGGVAFKYQRPVRDLAKATKIAKDYVDVITTSGTGTGKAADVGKISTMFDAAEGKPIAIASGITPDNVNDYLPFINVFMVATGINADFHNLDPEKTKRLVDAVRNF